MIEATNGKSLPVVDVFAMALKFIKDKAVEQICKREIIHPSNRKIHWIVTVPTIWTDAAKDVMRKAANKVIIIPVVVYNYANVATRPTATEV